MGLVLIGEGVVKLIIGNGGTAKDRSRPFKKNGILPFVKTSGQIAQDFNADVFLQRFRILVEVHLPSRLTRGLGMLAVKRLNTPPSLSLALNYIK